MKTHSRLKQMMRAVVVLALWGGAVRAANPCDRHFETEYQCYKSKYLPLPITPNPFSVCPGDTVYVCNEYTNQPGKQRLVLIRPDCSKIGFGEVSWVYWSYATNEWWETTGLFETNSSGKCATFTVPRVLPGSGAINFYLTYTNATPCDLGPYTITNSVTFQIDDTDTDLLPDCWEMQVFTNLNQTAEGNYDGDDLNNLQEYLHGTDPKVQDTAFDGNNVINLQVYTPLK